MGPEFIENLRKSLKIMELEDCNTQPILHNPMECGV